MQTEDWKKLKVVATENRCLAIRFLAIRELDDMVKEKAYNFFHGKARGQCVGKEVGNVVPGMGMGCILQRVPWSLELGGLGDGLGKRQGLFPTRWKLCGTCMYLNRGTA